jgi:hypothetical protein
MQKGEVNDQGLLLQKTKTLCLSGSKLAIENETVEV